MSGLSSRTIVLLSVDSFLILPNNLELANAKFWCLTMTSNEFEKGDMEVLILNIEHRIIKNVLKILLLRFLFLFASN